MKFFSPESSGPTLISERYLAMGAEHNVFVLAPDDAGQTDVAKIPHLIGRSWQDMTPDAAKRDLELLKRFGVPHLYTRVLRAAYLHVLRGEKKGTHKVNYLLRQPFLQYHAARYPQDLGRGCPALEVVAELLEKAYKMEKDHGLAMDMVGFASIKDLAMVGRRYLGNNAADLMAEMLRVSGIIGHRYLVAKLLSGSRDLSANLNIHNLFVPETSVDREGERVAEAGQVILSDVRLMPIRQGAGILGNSINPFIRFLYDAEIAALVALMQHCDKPYPKGIIQSDNNTHVFFRNLARAIFDMADRAIDERESL